MNEDFSPLEDQLRALRPLSPSVGLEARLSEALHEPLSRSRSWWEWLGFQHPMAAFGWGIVVPSAAAAMAITLFHLAVVPPVSSSDSIRVAQTRPAPSDLRIASNEVSGDVQDGNASSVLYETNDEGVVLTNGQQPAHRVRYRSEDTIQWRNPRTGASIEVSYPREEVVLTPISAK